jgi:hypothetical protein
VPLDAAASKGVTVAIAVLRNATPGQLLTNPSDAWHIAPTQAFAT